MHKVVNIGVVAGCVLTFAHATQTSAQNRTISSPDTIAGQERELDELLVTSSKAELTFNQTAKIVTVITRAEIERQPVQSVQDLLKNIVGLDVRQRGANGVLAGISVRGGTFEQTAILLNGANLSNPQTAHYSLDLPVNLSDIDRIEIIQGPTSLLYGAGAFSGGINIVTKKDSPTGIYLQADGGMHSTFGGEARASLQTQSANHSLSASYNSSDGYIDNSDYKIFNALWQSHFRTETARLDFQFGINDKTYGANTFYSAAYPNQFDDTRSVFGSLKSETGTKLKLIPQLYWNRHYDHYQLIRDSMLVNDVMRYSNYGENFHQSGVFGFSLNTQYKWQAGITNLGGEIRNEGILSSNLGRDSLFNREHYKLTDNRTNISYFVEHTYLQDRFTFGVGLLYNYNTAFKDASGVFPTVNAAYWLTDNFKIFASWNKAIRTPTFTDLYYKGATHQGNSDVQPEKSEAFEVGAKYTHPFVTASFNAYYMKGTNLIDWVKKNPEEKWQSRNLTNLDKKGFEVNLAFRMFTIGYVFLTQDKDAGEWISNYVLDYLHHKFTAGFSHPVYKGLTAGWQFRWQKREGTYTKYIDLKVAEETPYPAFSLLDVKLNYKIDAFNVYLKANNLFNVSYYDLGNIPQPGFWLMGGISYRL
ncbi:hypothetical protein AGMMS50262_16150 [Bacteroidia bacterium]|nr:hypothetical protein AGMMS50262_16150 [Bacteroidia bacterium]